MTARPTRRALLAGVAAAVATPPSAASSTVGVPSAPDGDAALIRACRRMVELHNILNQMDHADSGLRHLPHDHPAVLAREADVEAKVAEFHERYDEIFDLPAHTMAGLLAKAGATAAALERCVFISIYDPLDEQGDNHEQLAWRLARDVQRILVL